MPGSFNADPMDDGGWATTDSNIRAAWRCENTSRWPATAPGGSGVLGVSNSPSGAGVFGANNASEGNRGVGVQGNGPEAGVSGWSAHGNGVQAFSENIGLWAQGGVLAAHFEGPVECTHDFRFLGADCAEEFTSGDPDVEPGTVMVLGEDGCLRVSHCDYDPRVLGVVSGAGDYRPALVLDRQPSEQPRVPLALMGKVFCRVDATEVPIRPGDLLTTSSTAGHAMRAIDPVRAFGSVIGKALAPCERRRALVPILVTLG